MFKDVVVGIDGKEGGRDAIALAKVLCDPDGELTLAHVHRGDPPAPRVSWPTLDPSDDERIRAMLEQAREQAGEDAEIAWERSQSVAAGLHEQAQAIAADLIVVGSSRRGMLGRALIGDDTRESLNGAPCAVAVAPAGYSAHPGLMREIGVGYDASPESDHALGVARKLAAEKHTKLSAFEVVALPSYVYLGAPGLLAAESIRQPLVTARERLGALVGVEPHFSYGQPAEELALYSASLDVLVIGSRSFGPVGRFVHGSVAQRLARSARCPLLILNRAARTADAAGCGDEELARSGARQ
jgi:nucleotide-binding universal stress UspA family protein